MDVWIYNFRDLDLVSTMNKVLKQILPGKMKDGLIYFRRGIKVGEG